MAKCSVMVFGCNMCDPEHRCKRRATVKRGRRHYCWQHDPKRLRRLRLDWLASERERNG